MKRIAVLLIALVTMCGPRASADSRDPENPTFAEGNRRVKSSAVSDLAVLQPSRSENIAAGRIGVRFVIEPGWHIYWKNSGEAGVPTSVDWKAPQDWTVSAPRFPAPYKFLEKGDITTFGYQNEVLVISDVFSPLVIPETDSAIQFTADISFLVCKDICVPGGRTITLTIPFGTEAPLSGSKSYELFQRYDALTPRPLAQLHTLDGWEKFEITPVVSRAETAPGGKLTAALILSGFPIGAAPALGDRLQLFADQNDHAEAGRPVFSILPSGAANDPPRAIATFPVTLRSDAPPGTVDISGIGVLSCALCDGETDFVFGWKIPFEVSASPGGNSGAGWEENYAATSGHLLQFRELGHEESAPLPEPETQGLSSLGFFGAVLAALLAGMILNLMPCVLPVISLKVLGFVESGTQGRAIAIRNSLVFAAGVLTAFLALALIVISLKSLGIQAGWGFQFQHPSFVFGLTIVVFLLSLGFFEIYHVSPPGLQTANRAAGHLRERELLRHFFDGVLATLLSTPCTAPYLGTALAFALAQPAPFTIAIFLSIGLGLSLPYVLLSANTALLERLPKPGPWMDTFKQLLGFVLLGTAVWLLYVLQSLNPAAVLPTLLLLLVLFFILWTAAKIRAAGRLRDHPGVLRSLVLALMVFVTLRTWYALEWSDGMSPSMKPGEDSTGTHWAPYSAERADAELARGRAVFIDFTADWCITCKFNERWVLASSGVISAFESSDITPLKADWTAHDDAITQALHRYGGAGVPHYVILAPNQKPRILPVVLTPGMVIDALEKSKTKSP